MGRISVANWQPEVSGRVLMTALCKTFPTLRGVPGASPWDEHKFARWASGPAPSGAMRLAAAFVLSVWNGCCDVEDVEPWWNEGEYRVGRFDVVLAMKMWDGPHTEAFLAWCRKPFYP